MAANTYETVVIAEPEISQEQADQLIGRLKQTITDNNGNVTNEDRWGRRRLAYSIHGHREGFYSVLSYTADASVVNALEHLFRVTDSVIRHLTIRVIKKNKTFPPRRERPADSEARHGRPGEGDSRHGRSGPGGRSSGPGRRPEGTRSAAPASSAAPATTPTTPTPEGGTTA